MTFFGKSHIIISSNRSPAGAPGCLPIPHGGPPRVRGLGGIMNKHLRDSLVIGFALFSMFFGAGNVIFPPYLGKTGGQDWILGFLCFFLVEALSLGQPLPFWLVICMLRPL